MDAYDTGKGLPEQIDREGNTGFMQKIAAILRQAYAFSVSGDGGTFIQLLSTAAFAAFNTHLIRRTLSVHLAPTARDGRRSCRFRHSIFRSARIWKCLVTLH